ncbi:MAG: hypothetical protein IJ064_04985 [Bacteroidaceae bacterium]|nr:hypothetical protein [Bacteroidaceae bacterium]
MKRFLLFALSAFCFVLSGSAQTPNKSDRKTLATTYFYFDDVDGTIEAYPEYVFKGLEQRMMQVSSSNYVLGDTNIKGLTPQMQYYTNLFFARRTRTTVFVFDGQESAQGALMTGAIYAGSQIGLWAAMWEGLRDKVGDALTEANIAHSKHGSYKDYIKQSKPEELIFNGHEGGHITWRMDMSNSLLTMMCGVNIEEVYDLYSYYDEEYDKIVVVVFNYSETKEPAGLDVAAVGKVLGVLTEIQNFGSSNDKLANATDYQKTAAERFKRVDMIDYFKKHFHLKNTPKGCIATVKDNKLQLCDTTIQIVEIIRDTLPPDPPEEPKDSTKNKKNHGLVGVKNLASFAIIEHGAYFDQPFVEDAENIYMIQDPYSENAVIAVNKQSGDIRAAIKGKSGGDRPNIKAFNVHNDTLYLDVEGRGIVRYDGKSVESSPLIGEVKHGWLSTGIVKPFVLSPDGRYLAYGDENITVYDLKDDNKVIKTCGNDLLRYVVTDKGDLYGVNAYQATLRQNNGDDDGYETQGETQLSDLVKGKALWMEQIGDSIFLIGENKIAKTAADEFKWSPASALENITMNAAGLSQAKGGFAWITTDDADNRFALFTANNDKATPMKQLYTGIKIPRYMGGYIVQKADNIHIDSMGNVWMRSEEAGRCLVVVYNPNGIVGLPSLAGKYTEFKPETKTK